LSEQSLKLAVLQNSGKPGDIEFHLGQLEAAAKNAAGQGADLLLCSELFMSGYNVGDQHPALAQTLDGPFCRAASDIARQNNIALIYGYPEKQGDTLYNSARVIDKDGTPIGNYRKLHLAGDYENTWFTTGDATTLVEIAGTKIVVLICCDVEFVEAVRACRNLGADLVCVPTALREQYVHLAHRLIPTRAFENSLFIAYANHSGSEDNWKYCGASCVAAPDGTDIARAGSDEELVVVNLDLELIDKARAELPYLLEPRNDVFGC